MPIAVGTKAPDFTLKSKSPADVEVKLSNNFGKKNTVLLFFPLAFTGVCTTEMCDVTAGLNAYTERAAEIEVSYYHDDGQDEFGIVFVGPTAEAIHEAQRQAMIEDVSHTLARQFGDSEIGEVVALLNQLFARTAPSVGGVVRQGSVTVQAPVSDKGRRRLH